MTSVIRRVRSVVARILGGARASASPRLDATAPRARAMVAAILLPGLFVLLTDLLRRGRVLVAYADRPHALGYLATAVVSVALWAAFMMAIGDRKSRVGTVYGVVFIALFGVIIGVESAYHALWGSYCGLDGQGYSLSIPWAIVGTLPLSRAVVLFHLAYTFAVAVLVAAYARRTIQLGRRARTIGRVAAPAILVGMTFIPASYLTVQSSTPDVIYVHAMTGLVKERLGMTKEFNVRKGQRRSVKSVPPIVAKPARKRNVVLILQESQRADVTCIDPAKPCKGATPFSHAAAPDRHPFLQMRSVTSATAIAIATLWGGLPANATEEELRTAPLVWDYAHAAGYETGYWTSQMLLQTGARLFIQSIPARFIVTGTNIDPMAPADIGASDAQIVTRALDDMAKLDEPFFGVVHLSNVHQTYYVDLDDAPFQPLDLDATPMKMKYLRNYYMNAVHHSDRAVGRLIEGIRALPGGGDTIIVYTSDHGEVLQEQGFGHTYGMHDNQIRVPAWIDAPEGTLSPEEKENLVAAKSSLLWHPDLAATLLDLLGVWDTPEMAPFQAHMHGSPLTRPAREPTIVPLSNCSWVWECTFPNYGVMKGPLKLWGNRGDKKYRCYDVLKNPKEKVTTEDPGCDELLTEARRLYVDPWKSEPPSMPLVPTAGP